MSKSTCTHREFFPLYKALNKNRISEDKSFICSCGKKINYEFYGSEEIKANKFLSGFSCFLWIAPALAAITISAIVGFCHPIAFVFALLFVIAYHFAAMYYTIHSPMLILTEEKKGFFSR